MIFSTRIFEHSTMYFVAIVVEFLGSLFSTNVLRNDDYLMTSHSPFHVHVYPCWIFLVQGLELNVDRLPRHASTVASPEPIYVASSGIIVATSHRPHGKQWVHA